MQVADTLGNQSTFTTAWQPVCPVTATFQQPLNANCKTICYTSQSSKKVERKKEKNTEWAFNCSISTVKT